MPTRDMLVITDASGKIVAAAAHENTAKSRVNTSITPAHPEHKLYRIADVPEEIADLKNGDEFHRAITKHFQSEHAKIRLINPSEYRSLLFPKDKIAKRK